LRSPSEFVVRVANLAEAEGRIARRKVLEVIAAAMLWLAAAILMVAGVLILVAAVYCFLRLRLPAHWALTLVALLPLGAGFTCLILGRRAAGSEKKNP
jgi:cadmium resistance protein CadD (predicted permease)